MKDGEDRAAWCVSAGGGGDDPIAPIKSDYRATDAVAYSNRRMPDSSFQETLAHWLRFD